MSWRNNPNPCVKPPFGSYIDWSHPLAKGLVGCWVFNEHSGLLINDLSPCRNNGIIHGATWGNGLKFNGSSDYADLGIINPGNHLSIFSRVYLQTLDSSADQICSRDYSNDSNDRIWQFRIYDNKLESLIWNSGGTLGDEAGTTTLSLNTWYNFIGTWDGTTIRVYVNAVEDGPGTALSGTLRTETVSHAFIGKSETSDPGYIHAIIDANCIYNRGISLDEIEQFNAEPYCVIAWPSHRVIFDYGAGSTYTLSADAGAYTLSGTTADVLLNRLLSAETGTYALTGQEANLLLGYLLNAESGSYTLNGQTANLLLNRLLATESGSFTLTGQNTSLLLNRLLSTESGSFTLSGVNVNLLLDRVLGAEAGSFTLTGTDVNLVYSGSATYTLTADAGAFTLTGTNASLLVNRILTVDNGSFALSGQNAILLLNRLLTAGTGSFTLTGQDVSLLADRILTTETGELILNGQDASLLLNRLLSAQAGSLTLTGQNITLLANRKLNAESGLYSLVGTDVVFTWSGQPIAHGKLTITFTPRKPGFVFTPRKPGFVFTPRKPGITLS